MDYSYPFMDIFISLSIKNGNSKSFTGIEF